MLEPFPTKHRRELVPVRVPSPSTCGWWIKRSQLLNECLQLAVMHSGPQPGELKRTMSTENLQTKDDKLNYLANRFPQSTPNERKRFLSARKKNVNAAAAKLEEYLKWRVEHNLDDPTLDQTGDDLKDWKRASKLALEWAKKNETKRKGWRPMMGKNSATTSTATELPQMIFVTTDSSTGELALTNTGSLVLQVVPARIDRSLASAETYSLALAIYLDRKFDRDSNLMGSLFLDVRAGKGWPNPPAYNMMPFVRATSKQLHTYYPGRLDQCLMYPLPKAALRIWEMARPLLDRMIVNSVALVGGSDSYDAPLPKDELSEHADPNILDQIELRRLSAMEPF